MFQVLPPSPPLLEYNWHIMFLSFQGSAQSGTYHFHPRGRRPEVGHNCFCPSRSWPEAGHTVSILPGVSLEGNMWFLSSWSWPEQDIPFLSSQGSAWRGTFGFYPPGVGPERDIPFLSSWGSCWSGTVLCECGSHVAVASCERKSMGMNVRISTHLSSVFSPLGGS